MLLTIALFICIWLFHPFSERESKSAARIDFESALFEMNRVDPALFRGDPVIKYENGRKWYEWTYRSESDTLAIAVPASKCNLENLFSDRFSISSNSDLEYKLVWTDPRYANSRPPHRENKDSLHFKGEGKIGKP